MGYEFVPYNEAYHNTFVVGVISFVRCVVYSASRSLFSVARCRLYGSMGGVSLFKPPPYPPQGGNNIPQKRFIVFSRTILSHFLSYRNPNGVGLVFESHSRMAQHPLCVAIAQQFSALRHCACYPL